MNTISLSFMNRGLHSNDDYRSINCKIKGPFEVTSFISHNTVVIFKDINPTCTVFHSFMRISIVAILNFLSVESLSSETFLRCLRVPHSDVFGVQSKKSGLD